MLFRRAIKQGKKAVAELGAISSCYEGSEERKQ